MLSDRPAVTTTNQATPWPGHRCSTFFLCLFLAAAAVISFWPVVHAQFINYDDNEYVTNNPMVLRGLSWQGVRWAFTTTHASNWHPVTWLSHMFDVQVFGKNPAGPHVVNLLLHTANTVLLFLLLQRITGAQWRSVLAAGLFELHPLHVESVAWIAERKDVLSVFFGFLSLLTYAAYVGKFEIRNSKFETRETKFNVQHSIINSAWVYYGLALGFYALGLMSKPMLVTLPFVMLLLDFWPLRRFQLLTRTAQLPAVGRLLLEKAPFLLLSVAVSATTTRAQRLAIQPLEHLPLGDRFANGLIGYVRYLAKTFWPADLALPYLHPGYWPASQAAGAALLLVGLCGAAILAARRRPFVFAGWFWFLGTMVPVIGLVQVGTQSIADRYTYFPLIGIIIAVVWSAAELCVRWRIPQAVVTAGPVLTLAVCGVLTHRQAGYWHDSEQLFKHAAAVTKDNFIALENVGGVLFESGHLDEALEFYQQSYRISPRYAEAANSIGAVLAARGSDDAIEWFRRALELQPAHADALFNMGNAMARKGSPREAADYFRASLAVKPDNYEARNNLGNALVTLGRIDEAIVQYESAIEYKPEAALIHKNLGEMLAAKGRLDEAILQYRAALLHTNDASIHYSLGLTLSVQARWDEATQQYVETLRLAPNKAEAHYNLGYALKVKGRLDDATVHFREALRLKPEFALAHYNLACVLAETGAKEEATAHLREALRQKPDYEDAKAKLESLKK